MGPDGYREHIDDAAYTNVMARWNLQASRLIQHVGAAADSVVQTAGDVGADLIVLSWNQDFDVGRARVVRETLAQSSIPIVLLPTS